MAQVRFRRRDDPRLLSPDCRHRQAALEGLSGTSRNPLASPLYPVSRIAGHLAPSTHTDDYFFHWDKIRRSRQWLLLSSFPAQKKGGRFAPLYVGMPLRSSLCCEGQHTKRGIFRFKPLRVWVKEGTPPPKTGLWWCIAERSSATLSDWSQPVQIMTAQDRAWHAGPWKPSFQFHEKIGQRAFVFFDGTCRTSDPGRFPFAFALGSLEIDLPASAVSE